MLKFIKHHMAGIENIEIYPIISLMIFFIFFSAVTWYALKAPKRAMEENEMLPFDDSTQENRLN